MLQAADLDCRSLDPFSFHQNGLTASELDVDRREIVETHVVAQMVIVHHKRLDLRLQIAWQKVVLQQDAILERLVPTSI